MRPSSAILFLCLAAAAGAEAGEPRRHDGGFFLRIAPGVGFARTNIDEAGDELEFRGLSGAADIAIGWMVRPNLALHATLGGWTLDDPTVRFNGQEEDVQDMSLFLFGYGGGFTWYFGDSNVYLTAWGAAAELDFELDGTTETSDTGYALGLGVGKEWWVSDRWGLGVSLSAGYHAVPPGDAESRFKGPSFAVSFSATLN
jgi:hypothetical protein